MWDWISVIAVLVVLGVLWALLSRWTDLGHRTKRHAHDPDRVRALREARQSQQRGHRWGG
jgi:hypothetical protein